MKLLQIGRLFLAAILLLSQTTWAGLTATVDRTIISDLDLITLTIRASGNAADSPVDFSSLSQHFDIINESNRQNSSMSIVNGRRTSSVYKDYILTLSPKRMGQLLIPSFSAGKERSQPITIKVQQLTNSQRQRMNQFVFFETSVDTNETYVQGQIIYSVKLFYTEAIAGDFPQPPSVTDTVTETLENERRYESVIEGQRYYVLEKRYALFPQRSGALKIPRERFLGTRGGGMFSQAERINAVSKSHKINVKAIPTSFSGKNWLPAKSFSAKGSWTEINPIFRVGEPVNRILSISAIGLSGSILPQLNEMIIKNGKVYADPPTTENGVSPNGITTLQVTTLGVVPTKTGELALPELRIPWWNTQTDSEDVAIIPAVTYEVLPALTETKDTSLVMPPLSELNQTSTISDPSQKIWQLVAIAIGALWLFSSWRWLTLRRQIVKLNAANGVKYETATFSHLDESREFGELKKSCTHNLASETHRQLYVWGKARFHHIKSLLELGKMDATLAEEIITLEAHLYSGATTIPWKGDIILKRATALRPRKVTIQKNNALRHELNPS